MKVITVRYGMSFESHEKMWINYVIWIIWKFVTDYEKKQLQQAEAPRKNSLHDNFFFQTRNFWKILTDNGIYKTITENKNEKLLWNVGNFLTINKNLIFFIR